MVYRSEAEICALHFTGAYSFYSLHQFMFLGNASLTVHLFNLTCFEGLRWWWRMLLLSTRDGDGPYLDTCDMDVIISEPCEQILSNPIYNTFICGYWSDTLLKCHIRILVVLEHNPTPCRHGFVQCQQWLSWKSNYKNWRKAVEIWRDSTFNWYWARCWRSGKTQGNISQSSSVSNY